MEENNENLTEIYNDNQENNQDIQEKRTKKEKKLCFNSSKKSTT